MFRSELAQALKAMDLSVSESQLAQFCTFDEALVETNKVMNLTAITDPKGVAIKHMADSLSCYDPAVNSASTISSSVLPFFLAPA